MHTHTRESSLTKSNLCREQVWSYGFRGLGGGGRSLQINQSHYLVSKNTEDSGGKGRSDVGFGMGLNRIGRKKGNSFLKP